MHSPHCYYTGVITWQEKIRQTRYTKEFIDIGVDELSVSPQFVLALRKHIRELD